MSNKLRKLSKSINNTPRRHTRKKVFILKELRQNLIEEKMMNGSTKAQAEMAALVLTSPYKIDEQGKKQTLVDFSLLSPETQKEILGSFDINIANNEVNHTEQLATNG